MTEEFKIPWDGSNIGDITKHIKRFITHDYGVIVVMENNQRGFCNKYKNSIPLIADEIKGLFGLIKFGRNRCVISGKDFIISRTRNRECGFVKLPCCKKLIWDIRVSYLFRYIMGFTKNYDSSLAFIWDEQGFLSVTSYLDLNISYDCQSSWGSVITGTAIKKWFGDPIKIIETYDRLQLGFDFIFKVKNIINRIDKSMILWSYMIMKRIDEI